MQPQPVINQQYSPYGLQQPPAVSPYAMQQQNVVGHPPSPFANQQPMQPYSPYGLQPTNPIIHQQPNPQQFPPFPQSQPQPQPVQNQPPAGEIDFLDEIFGTKPKATVSSVTSGVNQMSVSGTNRPRGGTGGRDVLDFPIQPPPTGSSSNLKPLQPPPARTATPSKPATTAPPSSDTDINRCPICGLRFQSNTSNREINQHIDECLNADAIDEVASGSEPTTTRRSSRPPEPKPQIRTQNDTELVDSWSQWFNLSKMPWYYGAIDRPEAEEILRRSIEDSFLVRKSSVKDSYAISFYDSRKRIVTHSLIEAVPTGGYKFQDSYAVFPTLIDLITKSKETGNLVPPPRQDR
jgi:hypothetical protein